jgi:hypothetical protein
MDVQHSASIVFSHHETIFTNLIRLFLKQRNSTPEPLAHTM